ncbi:MULTISPECIES: hypothetical protein [unclassified Novosphingobium]|uniref:hypothetical protein n=1 Tax=unclassified Novosphingobium TaxID=2644732 RepID=UPI000D310959|nr:MULTISPECIES: hypothetical protein [unclassified Novosphingobium]PTR06406.1 hypothetical protein C8K11_12019 [Novosphingobium sp. GV055]PUA94825.1 hypothetical protein C8K12_12019 [Novosphingobium sp. GV061]PUB13750.1 hypothetical protein C8K14_12019 [Novosphingobium sp. GV079]PUB38448.1 hypothetical protein C8K10_12019 [Novosphingobium sp. GV027]
MDEIIAVVWPRPEDYPRFFEVCGPEDYPPTYIEFVQQALGILAAQGIDPGSIEKVHVDPDEMLQWCLRHHGKLDTETRALFAMFKVRSRHGKGAEAIN